MHCVCLNVCVCVCVWNQDTLGATQRANTQEQRAPASESHLGDRSGVRGANQAPGTRSQAAVLVAAPPGFSTHKGKGGESQAEGLPGPPRRSAASG